MSKTCNPRVVLVTRPTEYERLIGRHGTRAQAEFFLKTRGQSIENVVDQQSRFEQALKCVLQAIPVEWRRTRLDRSDLDRFLFQPDDIVVALGQDGLVPNIAKYLEGQPVVGLNPHPDRYEGVLVRHPPAAAADLLSLAASGRGQREARTMVEAKLDDGQRLLALNEVFIGHRTHQSAQYRVRWSEREERHSSSGVIVSTGTGSTGWARSIHRQRQCDFELPSPTDPWLAFFVREPWPSLTTGAELAEGRLDEENPLEVVSRMNTDGVIFGDGIEADRIEFNWGRQVRLSVSQVRLNLLVG